MITVLKIVADARIFFRSSSSFSKAQEQQQQQQPFVAVALMAVAIEPGYRATGELANFVLQFELQLAYTSKTLCIYVSQKLCDQRGLESLLLLTSKAEFCQAKLNRKTFFAKDVRRDCSSRRLLSPRRRTAAAAVLWRGGGSAIAWRRRGALATKLAQILHCTCTPHHHYTTACVAAASYPFRGIEILADFLQVRNIRQELLTYLLMMQCRRNHRLFYDGLSKDTIV